MCGIGGIANRPGMAPSPLQLSKLCDALAHRGPDGHATMIAGATGLAHTRLAIIDLATGQQPLHGPQGLALVGCGEIYNYVELWPSIEQEQPQSHSDFEVPLHLVAHQGARAVESLRGMYAFACASADGASVLLARDPFGIKPLYYVVSENGVAFASEPQALIAADIVKAELDTVARDELVDLKYVNGDRTVFAGIRRVLPGETITITNGAISERRLNSCVPRAAAAPGQQNEDALVTRFDAVFENSVNVHLRSDVPLGLFLSGGLDSTAILTMMARLSREPLVSFTANFDSDSVRDERAAAARAARFFKSEHVEVPFSETDFWSTLPAVAGALDDPTADYAILPTFKLAAEARRHGLKVVLSGEGGDELFAGYGRYRRMLRPWWLAGRPPRHRGVLDRLDVRRTPDVAWPGRMREVEVETASHGGSKLQNAQAVDIATWLPNDILLKLDRCLMAHGVEGRTPFLDPEVAKFAFNLPDNMKIRDGFGKWILRKWLERTCPVAEPFAAKAGFTVPVQTWIARRKSTLSELVARQPGIAEMCRPDAVRSLFAASEDKKLGLAAWSLLFYAVWHTIHFCGQKPEGDVFTLLRAT